MRVGREAGARGRGDTGAQRCGGAGTRGCGETETRGRVDAVTRRSRKVGTWGRGDPGTFFTSNFMHNSIGYVKKQLVHALSCALSSYGGLGKFGDRRIHDMLTLTYRALNGNTPVYIKNLLNVKDITYNLRGQHLLNVPRVNTTTYGLHSFRYFASKLWNSLPNSLRTAPTTNAFKLAVNQIKFDRDCCPFCNLA